MREETRPTPGNRQTMHAASEIQAGETPCSVSVANPATASTRITASSFSWRLGALACSRGSAAIGPCSGNIRHTSQTSIMVLSKPRMGKCSKR